MGDVPVAEPSDEVEFDVITTEMVEQPSTVPEEDLHQVDLHLVQLPGPEQRLGRPRPMDHDRPVPGGGANLTGAVLDIGDETRVTGWYVPVVHLVGEDEHRHAVVMVALPAPREFEGPSAGDHRAGRQRFTVDLSARTVGLPVVQPVEEPSTVTSELLTWPIVRPGDIAVERHRNVEPNRIVHPGLPLSSTTTGFGVSRSADGAALSQGGLQATCKLIGAMHRSCCRGWRGAGRGAAVKIHG